MQATISAYHAVPPAVKVVAFGVLAAWVLTLLAAFKSTGAAR